MRQHRVVACHLAVQRELALDPPHTRHKKQQRFYNLLRQVGPVIAPAQVRQLMQDNVLQLFRRCFFQQPLRQHNRWLEKTDGRWHLQPP